MLSSILICANSVTLNRLLLVCLTILGMSMPMTVHAQQLGQIPYGYGYPPYLVTPVPHYPMPYGFVWPPSPYTYSYILPYSYYPPYLPPSVPQFDVSKITPAGRLIIKVQPDDAEVMVDGYQLSPADNNTYEIGLLVGTHKVDARKPNYGNYSEVVEVKKNEGLLVTITLQELK